MDKCPKCFFFAFSVLLLFVDGHCQISSQGLIGVKPKIFNPETRKYQIPKYYNEMRKVWYRDSIVIEELISIKIVDSVIVNDLGDTINIESWKNPVDKFVYIDLKNRYCFDYKAFSTDSPVIKKYISDTGASQNQAPWPFFDYHHIWKADTTFPFTDTTMDGVDYKRIKGYIRHADSDSNAILIGYLRCDKKGTIFHFDRAFDERNDCPLLAIEIIEKRIRQFYEIVFLRDTLTNQELAVFDAWERNAKAHKE